MKNTLPVYVLSIAKNEEQFVKRWAESAKEADAIYLLDTGSSDDTVGLAAHCGINVFMKQFNPWRFDVARNYLLDMLPPEEAWLIWLDVDEVLLPGWRKAFDEVPPEANRMRYKYVWSWNPDGSEGLVYSGDKIVKRTTHRWKHPVHEVNKPLVPEVQHFTKLLEINHHADNSKPRSQYLPLLKMSVEEDPDDDRNAYYYARELYFYGQIEDSINEFKRYLSLPRAAWQAERAWAMRYLAKMLPQEKETWLLRACAEYPQAREPWVDLAQYYYDKNNYEGLAYAAGRAIRIIEKGGLYLNESDAWGWRPHDLYALGCYQIGSFENAFIHGSIAIKRKPDDERLKKNLEYYAEKINPQMLPAFKAVAASM